MKAVGESGSAVQQCFVAFDVLLVDGQNLANRPQQERADILSTWVGEGWGREGRGGVGEERGEGKGGRGRGGEGGRRGETCFGFCFCCCRLFTPVPGYLHLVERRKGSTKWVGLGVRKGWGWV